jgi:hypothetical protein
VHDQEGALELPGIHHRAHPLQRENGRHFGAMGPADQGQGGPGGRAADDGDRDAGAGVGGGGHLEETRRALTGAGGHPGDGEGRLLREAGAGSRKHGNSEKGYGASHTDSSAETGWR